MTKTDVLIIGAGPTGLFAVFELGLLNLNCHLIDNLDKIGGQCHELYPEKPIYDIPSRTRVSGKELIDNLKAQAMPFDPKFHLNQQASTIEKVEDNNWKITTSLGNSFVCKCIVIAGGAGSFVPRRPPIESIDKYEGQSVLYSIKDKSIFNGKRIVIAGGGDSALDWTNELASIAHVTLIHRRKEFRAAPDSVKKMLELEKKGKIRFVIGQLTSIRGENGLISEIGYKSEDKDLFINTDFLLPFYGLKMELGPIIGWGINLHENKIQVDTEKFETSEPSIFAIGDICTYPGKLKLILSGFHEAALMAQQCFRYCYPDKKLIFRYTTTSKDLHKKLGEL
jgi:thioredoxin reductase (NADPH)